MKKWAKDFTAAMRASMGNDASDVEFAGEGSLPSAFAVTDFAAASIATAGLGIADLVATFATRPSVSIDRRMASHWFATSLYPVGWELPPMWDDIAGDYRTSDGWIKLHTNAPHHRHAALTVLHPARDRSSVAEAVRVWRGIDLESAVVAAGGCAAEMRSASEWRAHPQGAAVSGEPLVALSGAPEVAAVGAALPSSWTPTTSRPLAGLKVLDLTRVIAGPVATRFLAGLGANVVRIDPPWWEETGVAVEVTVGKRCARLDLRSDADRERFELLVSEADVVVRGYRNDALARLGYGDLRSFGRSDLVDVALDAYGWTGPWAQRRGFDSLVQLSSGIAHEGMVRSGKDQPTSLPVQALDHATGYLAAAAVAHGLVRRRTSGQGTDAWLSLARTAAELLGGPAGSFDDRVDPVRLDDFPDELERTAWGEGRRLRAPFVIEGVSNAWASPAVAFGTHNPLW